MNWKKYFVFAIISVFITIPIFFAGMVFAGLVAFGMGNSTPYLYATYGITAIIILVLSFLHSKRNNSPFIKSLITAIIPIVLFLVFLAVTNDISRKKDAENIRRTESFRNEAIAKLPQSFQIKSVEYLLHNYENNFRLRARLNIDIATDFDRASLEYGLRFYPKDLHFSNVFNSENYNNQYILVDGCTVSDRMAMVEVEKGKRYKPGNYIVVVDWWFSGNECTVEKILTLENSSIVIRDAKNNKVGEIVIDEIKIAGDLKD